MLSAIVGNVDINSAFVLVALILAVCIMVTAMIAKRRSRIVLSNEFELEKIKLRDKREVEFAQIANKKEYEMKLIDAGQLTSHKVG